jgi:hypothetical protein
MFNPGNDKFGHRETLISSSNGIFTTVRIKLKTFRIFTIVLVWVMVHPHPKPSMPLPTPS